MDTGNYIDLSDYCRSGVPVLIHKDFSKITSFEIIENWETCNREKSMEI